MGQESKRGRASHLEALASHDLDGQVVANGRQLLEEDDRPVAALACSTFASQSAITALATEASMYNAQITAQSHKLFPEQDPLEMVTVLKTCC